MSAVHNDHIPSGELAQIHSSILLNPPALLSPSVSTHTCNPSIQDTVAENSECEANLAYIVRLVSKTKTNIKTKTTKVLEGLNVHEKYLQ